MFTQALKYTIYSYYHSHEPAIIKLNSHSKESFGVLYPRQAWVTHYPLWAMVWVRSVMPHKSVVWLYGMEVRQW